MVNTGPLLKNKLAEVDLLRAANANLRARPAVQEPVALDLTIEGDEARALYDQLGDDREDPNPIRMVVGDGHSGYGLYVAQAEYQDEGAVLITSITPPSPPLQEPVAIHQFRAPGLADCIEAYTAIKQARSAPVQEPAKRVCSLGCKNLGACCADPKCEAVAATPPAPVQPVQPGAPKKPALPYGWNNLTEYILQDDLHNRLTPRVVDIAYSAFMSGRTGKNKDDGGPCDWFNDTKPMVLEALAKIRKDLAEAAHNITKGGAA
jgi:hypothetical protein